MFQGGRRRMSLDSYGSQYRAPPPYAVSGTAMGWGPQPTTTIIEHQPYSVEHQPYSVISQHRPIPAVTTTTSYVTPLRTSPQKLVSEWQDGVQREYTPQDDGDAWEESAVETADENSDGEQVNSRPSRRRNQRESHRSLGCQNCDDLKHQVADLQREVELLKNELLKTEPQCDECPRLRAEVQRYRQLLERQELRGGADDSLSNYTHDDGNAFRRNNSYDAEKRSNPVIINPPISRQPPAAGQKSRHEPLDITQAFASPSKSLTGAARARGVYAPKDEHVPWNTLPENASSNFARSNSNSIEYDDPMGSIDLCKVLGIRVNVRPTRRGEHDGIIVVKDVNLGSLAERSGIRVNDTIYEWNHRAILTEQTWRSMLSNATYGSVIRFGLLRDGIPYQALVTVPMPSS